MKKSIFALAGIMVVAGTILTSCKPKTAEEQESEEKVEVARENLWDAKDSLNVARQKATDEEWKAFKRSGDSTIIANNLKIAALKLKIRNTGNNIDSTYQKSVYVMEERNKNLKLKMDAYKNDVSSDWQSFKREFKHDTDEIGQALKDLTVNNKE
jgi:predicted RNase H-like nuclease (RuvC/YqgF family)